MADESSSPKPKKEDRGLEGPTPGGVADTTRQGPPIPTGVKEHRPVPDEDLEPGSGPIVEQVLDDHIPQAPRESDVAPHLQEEG